METIEQKPKSNIAIYIIIIILIIAIIAVYFIFFAPEKLATSESAITPVPVVNTATEEVGSTATTKTTMPASVTSRATSTDITGGLSSLKLTPEDILNNPIFQSLHSYAEPVEVPSLGRPNPFIPY
ncbi:MAG TPA: hypothetical protein PLB74_00680 [Candidatus Paceibacterota bacterium]|nr:hypothetical protein [Candidatus Paceibacterota bacterium]